MDATTGTTAPRLPIWLEPIGWVGQTVIAAIGYVGGIASLLVAAFAALFRIRSSEAGPGLWKVLKAELWWLLVMGLPLVGLVHVGMGSFLSLQAYFGSTFVDGTGAVVGVGLLRNLATLMTGLTMSGLLAGRIISEFIARGHANRERREAGPMGRELDLPIDDLDFGDPGRLAAPRMAAAAVATTLLSLWGVLVGTAVGWQCADTMMGLSYETFFMMFYQMIWFRDVLGVVCKGVLFGLFPAAICCYEGLGLAATCAAPGGAASHPGHLSPFDRFGGPIVRATSLSMVSVLLVNMTWFLLVYHAVPVFGPSLLNPPGP